MSAGAVFRVPGVELAGALADLHERCFSPLPETPWSEQAFRTVLRLPGTVAWIAGEIGNHPQGLLVVREMAGEWEVLTVCVDPDARGTGLARALFAAFLDTAGPQARIVLEVAAGNDAALALYRGLGFVPAGRRPGYYGGNGARVDALILAREPEGA